MGWGREVSRCDTEKEICVGLPLLDLVLCLAEVADFVSPAVFKHHLRVAYLAFRLGEVLGLSRESCEVLLFSGLLHDLGAFSLRDRLDALHFEFANPHYHAFVAYALFKDFEPFSAIANVVRFHHVPWEEGRGRQWQGVAVPLESHILHFADRVSIVCSFQEDPVGEAQEREGFLRDFVPHLFHPEIFEAFRSLLRREYIWLDLASPHLHRFVGQLVPPGRFCLGARDFLAFSQMVSHLIDFRSPFTATHSAGVAHVAHFLGNCCGFSKTQNDLFFAAGFLHDLGKLAIPLEILEKPGALTPKEMNIMKTHAYYTFLALYWIRGLRDVALWAAEHHERCNSRGYPFGRAAEELLFESKVMAVADVFTALAEDRPYRRALPPQRIREILADMALSDALDRGVVEILLDRFSEVYNTCREAQRKAASVYDVFRKNLASFP
ncbi:MAG: HD domain-containing phosphohydrolase [Atribacterota bacterium]